MGQIELNSAFKSLLFLHLNCVFMLNGTVLKIKLRTYAKLNFLKTYLDRKLMAISTDNFSKYQKMIAITGAVEYNDCISAEGQDPHNKCPRYDTKQSDGEAPVMLKHWGMRNIPSLLSLPGLLWPGVVAPVRVLSMSQIELNCVLMLN